MFEEGGSKAALGELGYKIFGIKKRLFSNGLVPIQKAEDCKCDNYVATLR
jgi:hypothetical protein